MIVFCECLVEADVLSGLVLFYYDYVQSLESKFFCLHLLIFNPEIYSCVLTFLGRVLDLKHHAYGNLIFRSPELMVEGKSSGQNTLMMEEIQLYTNWDDVMCSICLDFPHNAVLLQCASYEKGCRSFVCDTDHLHSNCLYRFKQANGVSPEGKSPSTAENILCAGSESDSKPACPLCRGEVTGWVVVNKARKYLDEKKRCCEEQKCRFSGTYSELQKHAQVEHPHGCPSKIDPARQLDWDNFQQSAEIIDVLSTIHSEVPRGVVLGDYVIEYGDDNSDDYDDFPRNDGNWWTSCILYHVFDKFRASRNRRRSRVSDARRGNLRLSFDTSNSDVGSVSSAEYADYRADETDDEYVNARALSRRRVAEHSSRRRRSRFFHN
ncbi:uncharacterized protein LOC121780935 isoform X1 [Salvia splendens]|uniref:uncharacterized protein LOC121780935 isoform X1 n=2 Tax=Salvia splendens TaxID=180675 RepID=UPI001C25C192|nr:uncharacterized protein LOC121780935 isoform X1 [Salvia splendens]XP_042034526.1 uncharacterized protein LOC121780935 isoform X1 [Salvia splendens]XP_042034527.1 uncharacterized protein LOC121780935 isoform X1 [Salvia splendens]